MFAPCSPALSCSRPPSRGRWRAGVLPAWPGRCIECQWATHTGDVNRRADQFYGRFGTRGPCLDDDACRVHGAQARRRGRLAPNCSSRVSRACRGYLIASSIQPASPCGSQGADVAGSRRSSRPPLVVSRVHWLEPKLIAEITYLTWTADNLLRHTVYVELREDKPAGEVRSER